MIKSNENNYTKRNTIKLKETDKNERYNIFIRTDENKIMLDVISFWRSFLSCKVGSSGFLGSRPPRPSEI